MTSIEVSISAFSVGPAAAHLHPRRSLVRRVAAYGLSRGATEVLLAIRSVLLAAMLGPAAFGSWALLRLGTRYAGLASVGVYRGLELELLQGDGKGHGARKDAAAATALGFILLVGGGLSLLALLAIPVVSEPRYRLVLAGFAAANLAELVYGYAMVWTRVRTGLRRFAIMETGTAAIQVALAVGLAWVYGLAGAFAGLALANLMGILITARWVDFRAGLALEPLRRLFQVGFPVTLTSCVGILLTTADRWVVAFWGGPIMLGYYTLAASVTSGAMSLALVIRTVVFRQVYGEAFSAGAATALRAHLERSLLPFARLLPPLLGAASFAVGPVVAFAMPGYTEAIGPARLFLLVGAASGLVSLAAIGAIAAGRQRRMPLLAGAALSLTTVLAILALLSGAGLKGVAGAALAGHLLYAAAVLQLIVRETGAADVNRFVLITLLPLVWCAAAVAIVGRVVPDNSIASAALGLGLYLLLVLPLAPGWRTELRRLRH